MGQRDLLRRALLMSPGREEGVRLGSRPFNYQLPIGEDPSPGLGYTPWGPLDEHLLRYGAPEGTMPQQYGQQQDPKILMQEMLRQSALPGMDQMGAGPQMSKFRQARIDSLRNSAQFGAPSSRKSTDQQSLIDQLLLR